MPYSFSLIYLPPWLGRPFLSFPLRSFSAPRGLIFFDRGRFPVASKGETCGVLFLVPPQASPFLSVVALLGPAPPCPNGIGPSSLWGSPLVTNLFDAPPLSFWRGRGRHTSVKARDDFSQSGCFYIFFEHPSLLLAACFSLGSLQMLASSVRSLGSRSSPFPIIWFFLWPFIC